MATLCGQGDAPRCPRRGAAARRWRSTPRHRTGYGRRMANPTKLCLKCETVAIPIARPRAWDQVFNTAAPAVVLAVFIRDRGWYVWLLPIFAVAFALKRLYADDPGRCAACGSFDVVPLDTPVAQARLRAQSERAG